MKAYTLHQVMADIESGFNTMAAKKETLANISRIYEKECWKIRHAIIDSTNKDALNDIYWSIPQLPHQWNNRISANIAKAMPEMIVTLDQINDIVSLRDEVKSMQVNAKPVETETETKLRKTIEQQIIKSKADYANGLELKEIFGELPVSVDMHYVVNQYGTEYIRCFYYLAGKIVKLSVIIALMQDTKKA